MHLARLLENKKRQKNQNWARVSGVPIFSCKGQSSRSRSLDIKNLKKLLHIWHTCLLTVGQTRPNHC